MPGIMNRIPNKISLTEDQALFFRARRQHLAGPGAPDPVAAARSVVGIQSQQLNPSFWGLSLRTCGRPSAAELAERIWTGDRTLVRTWGQRDTIHIFDPAAHWAPVVAARARWAPMGRRGGMPPQATVNLAEKILARAEGPVGRTALFEILPPTYLDAIDPRVGDSRARLRFAAGRLLWRLNQEGKACIANKVGAEQTYAARRLWFPDLAWPEPLPDPEQAAAGLTADYLGAYGPATVQDIAHFFGAPVSAARRWLELLGEKEKLVGVDCGGRMGLVALAADGHDLAAKPPSGVLAWPVRLLPLWDGLLMGHADKSWTVPDPWERTLVWRRAAHVAAVVMARGRIVGTWTHRLAGGELAVRIKPLGGWSARRHLGGVKKEIRALARHLGASDWILDHTG